METVRIRERNGVFQLYEKNGGKIIFRGKSRLDCFKFLNNNADYSYEPTKEKGIHYVY
jgi:hypothetical protein